MLMHTNNFFQPQGCSTHCRTTHSDSVAPSPASLACRNRGGVQRLKTKQRMKILFAPRVELKCDLPTCQAGLANRSLQTTFDSSSPRSTLISWRAKPSLLGTSEKTDNNMATATVTQHRISCTHQTKDLYKDKTRMCSCHATRFVPTSSKPTRSGISTNVQRTYNGGTPSTPLSSSNKKKT